MTRQLSIRYASSIPHNTHQKAQMVRDPKFISIRLTVTRKALPHKHTCYTRGGLLTFGNGLVHVISSQALHHPYQERPSNKEPRMRTICLKASQRRSGWKLNRISEKSVGKLILQGLFWIFEYLFFTPLGTSGHGVLSGMPRAEWDFYYKRPLCWLAWQLQNILAL